MSSHTVVTADDLPNEVIGNSAPLWWGFVMLMIIEATVFAALIVSYFYLRFHALEWPLEGLPLPELLLPTIGSGVLLLSLAPITWGGRGIVRNRRWQLVAGLLGGVVLLLAFIVLKVIELTGLTYSWASNAYGSLVWVSLILYLVHLAALIILALAVAAVAATGYYTAERRITVQVTLMFWYFLALVWLPLYATLYLAPYVI